MRTRDTINSIDRTTFTSTYRKRRNSVLGHEYEETELKKIKACSDYDSCEWSNSSCDQVNCLADDKTLCFKKQGCEEQDGKRTPIEMKDVSPRKESAELGASSTKSRMEKLKTMPPKPQKLEKHDGKISDVRSVKHTLKVTFDEEKGIFAGVPKEWQGAMSKQFGVSPKQLPCVKLPNYTAKIPKVLVTLKERLVAANGYQQTGIFRLQPDARESNIVKSALDSGIFKSTDLPLDVNIYANLIKVWFRELPDPLLHSITPQQIEMVSTEKDVAKLITQLDDPWKSLLLWLCDICVECATSQNVNKMDQRNLAIVIAPNLFTPPNCANPTKAVMYSAKAVEFFEKAIKWRHSNPSQEKATP